MVRLDPSSMPSYGFHGAHLESTTAASAGAGPLARCLLRTLHGILPWFSTRQNRHCRHHPPQDTKERWGSSLASGSERDKSRHVRKVAKSPMPVTASDT
jgi:hypothetical protein